MAKINKVPEQKVREVITNTNQLIIDSALHLVSTTGERSWIKCCEKMDPTIFVQWTNVPHTVWIKFINSQDSTWVGIIQMAFDINYNKQLKIASEVFE